MPTDAEEWRQRYLAAIAVQLALVEYLGDPDATTAGVMRILAGVDIEKDN